MVFERGIDGIEVKLRIDDYQDPSKHVSRVGTRPV